MNRHLLRTLARPESRTLLLIAICATLLLSFVVLTEVVLGGGTTSVDETLLLLMRETNDIHNPIGPGWFEEMARDFTALGGIPILLALTFVVTCYLALGRNLQAAAFILGTAITVLIVSTLLKALFDRPRPDLVEKATRVYTSSFPSAHAMMSACMYLAFASLLARFESKRSKKITVLCFAAAAIVIVGLSRVYLGVHWPTDILAGWTAGAIWALLCWLVYRHYDPARKLNPKTTEITEERS